MWDEEEVETTIEVDGNMTDAQVKELCEEVAEDVGLDKSAVDECKAEKKTDRELEESMSIKIKLKGNAEQMKKAETQTEASVAKVANKLGVKAIAQKPKRKVRPRNYSKTSVQFWDRTFIASLWFHRRLSLYMKSLK